MDFNRKLVSKATWSTWQLNDVQHPFGTTAKIGVLRISPLYKLLARLGPSQQKKKSTKQTSKALSTQKLKNSFRFQTFWPMFAWKSENQSWILCLFSILGHKFHNVLWVDLSCIEKNVLSWAHLKNGGSWALWTLEVGEVEDHQCPMAIDVFFDIHCEFRCILNLEKSLFMLRFLNKKPVQHPKSAWLIILKLCIYSLFKCLSD